MKKTLLQLFVATILFASCKKDDSPPFDASPDERLNQALLTYQTQLAGAENGWKTAVYPAGGGGYSYYMKFNDQNRVVMIADFDLTTGSTPAESSYRLKALQQPSLIFDTYSYLHIPADPRASVNGGTNGQGLSSDFEFAIDSSAGDSIKLTGRIHGTKMTLVKATAEEAAGYTAGGLGKILTSTIDYLSSTAFLYLQFPDGTKNEVGLNLRSKLFTFSYVDAQQNIITLSSPFSFSLAGINLKTPITYGDQQFYQLFWDNVKKVYYIMLGDATRIDVRSTNSPIIPLFKKLGQNFTIINIPPPSGLPGQSQDFAAKYLQAKNAIKASFNLDLQSINFHFDNDNKVMLLEVQVLQNSNPFVALYGYSYTITADGIVKFTRTGSNGNADLIEADMDPLLQHVDSDRFRMDYYIDGSKLLAGMYSVTNPDFYFTGNME